MHFSNGTRNFGTIERLAAIAICKIRMHLISRSRSADTPPRKSECNTHDKICMYVSDKMHCCTGNGSCNPNRQFFTPHRSLTWRLPMRYSSAIPIFIVRRDRQLRRRRWGTFEDGNGGLSTFQILIQLLRPVGAGHLEVAGSGCRQHHQTVIALHRTSTQN